MSHTHSIASRGLTSRTIFGHGFVVHARVTFILVPRDLVEEQLGKFDVKVGYGMFWVSSKCDANIKKGKS
jgi:hypothetical protein